MENTEILDKIFRFCGVSKDSLYTSLRKMNTIYLQKNAKKLWSEDNPTIGYSYEIAEFLYYYIAPQGSKFMKVWVPSAGVFDWFVQWPDDTVVDLSLDQFSSLPNYSKAKPAKFEKESPTKVTKRLATLMGMSDEDLDNLNVTTKTKKARN